MLALVEWLVTLIILVLVIGILYYLLRRAMALVEVNPKVQEGILLVVLLVIVLFAIGFALSGNLKPLIQFGGRVGSISPPARSAGLFSFAV
jgi:hypothetical protein